MSKFDWSRLPMESVKFQKKKFFVILFQNNAKKKKKKKQETLFNQVRECTALIIETKERYTTIASAKLDNLDFAPKHIGQLSIDF